MGWVVSRRFLKAVGIAAFLSACMWIGVVALVIWALGGDITPNF